MGENVAVFDIDQNPVRKWFLTGFDRDAISADAFDDLFQCQLRLLIDRRIGVWRACYELEAATGCDQLLNAGG